jgi:glycosyltransferase involved in cell wall biosynthesis
MKPRVAILTGIFPPDIGGPATSVPELAQSLIANAHDVFVVTLADHERQVAEDPCPVIRIPRRLGRRRALAVCRAVLTRSPDAVFANGLHIESTLLLRVPVVQKLVGDWAWERARNAGATDLDLEAFQDGRLPPKPRVLRALRSVVTRRAKFVVAPSRHFGRIVAGWGFPESRIRIIPNAAPPLVADRPPVRRGKRVLFVGRLVPWKNVDHVLHVLPGLPVALDVIGSGPELAPLQALTTRLGLDDRVSFLGPLSRAEVLERMDRAALLVLPSSHEGMPHVVLEAFARGLPVVASDGGGTPEIVENNVSGFVYPVGDLARLEGAIARALTPEPARQVVQGGFAVARRLSVRAMTEATAAVVHEALNGLPRC